MKEPTVSTLRIGVLMGLDRDPGELFADARAIEAAGADSLWCDAKDCDPYVMLASLAAVTWRVRLVARGAPAGAGRRTCEQLARGRLVVAEEAERTGERWTLVPYPKDRAAWRETRRVAAADGQTGLVLANDPRLIDLLRNPDQEDDRADLNIAVG
jgi:hypothetical protein